MKEWTAEDVRVKEVAFEGDVHGFEVYYQDMMMGTIEPDSIEEMEELREKLDKGANPLAEGWKDGRGNPLTFPQSGGD